MDCNVMIQVRNLARPNHSLYIIQSSHTGHVICLGDSSCLDFSDRAVQLAQTAPTGPITLLCLLRLSEIKLFCSRREETIM